MTTFSVFAGVDWATQEHQVCAITSDGAVLGERAFQHSGHGLAQLQQWLAALGEPNLVAVAIETPRGPVVEALLERGFSVFALNPKQMDRFRDRFSVAGAKDDRFDARVLADSLRTDRSCFRELRVDDPRVIELREWSRMVDELQEERQRLANRIRAQLWRYFPQFLELCDDPTMAWFLELWKLVPTPSRLKHLPRNKVLSLLNKHHVRRVDVDGVMRTLKQPPLKVAPGTVEAASAHVAALVQRLELVNLQYSDGSRRLDSFCDAIAEDAQGQIGEQRDVEILRSFPGLGRIVLATLLAEANQPLRDRDYHALRTLCGVAPVTKRSGKTCVVSMRRACARSLRDAVFHWARCAVQRDVSAREKYAALRKRGHSHGRALRSVADRLLYVACSMLRQQALFDPDRRTAAAA